MLSPEVRERHCFGRYWYTVFCIQTPKRKLDAELAQAARRLAEIKYNCSEEESERIKQLDEREHEIKQSKMELDRARSRMDREWADIKATQANLEQRVAAEMEAERASHERAIAKLESQRESAWSKADELKEKLADLQELAQALGDQSAADILGQLDELKRENAMLKRSLEQSDTSELQREIDYLRSSKADHHMRAVIGFISQLIGCFVMVGGTDKPDVARHKNLAPITQHDRRIGHGRLCKADQTLIPIVFLKSREKLCKVLLGARKVHLIEKNHITGISPARCLRLIKGLQTILLVETSLKGVVVAEQIIPITPARLDGNIGTEATHGLGKSLRQTGLTRTTDALEDMQLTHSQSA